VWECGGEYGMSGSRCGFSYCEHSAATVSMPSMAFLLDCISYCFMNTLVWKLFFTSLVRLPRRELLVNTSASTSQKIKWLAKYCLNMSQRVGVTTVKVITLERSSNHPFREKWSGLINLNGNKVRFSTDECLREGERYRVVWERTEPIVGKQIIRIHEVIENEPHANR